MFELLKLKNELLVNTTPTLFLEWFIFIHFAIFMDFFHLYTSITTLHHKQLS